MEAAGALEALSALRRGLALVDFWLQSAEERGSWPSTSSRLSIASFPVGGSQAGVGGAAEPGERAARATLRAQIASSRPSSRGSSPSASPSSPRGRPGAPAGPRLPDLEELERTRDRLAARLSELNSLAALRREHEHQPATCSNG